jgi:hypothetical protein
VSTNYGHSSNGEKNNSAPSNKGAKIQNYRLMIDESDKNHSNFGGGKCENPN